MVLVWSSSAGSFAGHVARRFELLLLQVKPCWWSSENARDWGGGDIKSPTQQSVMLKIVFY